MTSAASLERFMRQTPPPLLLDVETTGLKADYGLALVIGVRAFDPKRRSGVTRQFILDRTAKNWEVAERRMLREFRRVFDIYFRDSEPRIITFNGTRFDVPFLQARLAAQGLPLLPKTRHLDNYYTVKRTFGYTITSRRAKYVESLFQVGDPKAPHKDSSQMFTWLRATFARDKSAFQRIVNHNYDECLESLYYQTRRLYHLLPRTVPLR
jgi:uncharacterized protein YprB with RNaseH-like and TPR domain